MKSFPIHKTETGIRILILTLTTVCIISASVLSKASEIDKGQMIRQSDKRITSEDWAMRLTPGENPDHLAISMGAENLGQIGLLANTYLFRFPGTRTRDQSSATRDRLKKESRVEWYEQQEARWRFPRDIRKPDDPLFPDQWHLENTGQSGNIGEDVNVIPAWNMGFTGEGVVIGIVDDGLQYEHPDLEMNYRDDLSYDFNGNDADPAPSVYYDSHGTSAAGVAAARDNDTCGVGAAYRASLAGLRLIAMENTDADEADCLSFRRDAIHIYSNSWGPDDDGQRLEGPGPLAAAVLEEGIKKGRGGLGSLYVWAAGNGLRRGDNINYDGYANSRFTIAVGAVDHNGQQSDYSEPGAAMLVTAPSDSGYSSGIVTTDLMGRNGYSSDDCRDNFGGTSSSAPLVAGIVALMSEANPNLSWRDVQHILIKSAVRNDPGDEDWTINAAGLHVSHKYGFGRADAAAAVALASLWPKSPDVISFSYGPEIVDQIVPDSTDGITSVITVKQNLKLEHVEVVFNADHADRGHLQVVLTSPSGTQSVLAESHRDSHSDYDNWTFMTVRHWDESSYGDWTLTVTDLTYGTQGVYESWELILHGTHAPLARDDSAFTDRNTGVIIDVLANDSDVDNDVLTVENVTEPAHGTVHINSDNTVTYIPETGFTGQDMFSYTVSSPSYTISGGKERSAPAGVTLTVASDFALHFDGRDDYVDCGKSDGLNLTSAMTIEAWIRPSGWGERTDLGGYGRVVDKEKFILFLNGENSDYTNHSLVFATDLSDGSFSASSTPENSIRLDQWQHLAVTYDGTGVVRMYINGEAQTLHQPYDPPSGPVADNSGFTLFIGESANQNRAFKGEIDDVRIWNMARSQEEIQSDLYVSLSGKEEGLAGYWPMDPPGDPLADRSGNEYDGLIFGAVWDEGAPTETFPRLSSALSILKILTGTKTAVSPEDNTVEKISMAEAIRILQKISGN